MKRNPLFPLMARCLIFLYLSLLLFACQGTQTSSHPFTIGIINPTDSLTPTVDGFKAGMTDLGYLEGEQVTYIYHGVTAENQADLTGELTRLLAEPVDLLFVLGDPAAVQARLAVADTSVPVVFALAVDPLGNGLVKSTLEPGGNLTGVQAGPGLPKSLEWLLQITPATKAVYVPFDPTDRVASSSVPPLIEAARSLTIELVPVEIYSPEDLTDLVETLPADAAIFLVPTAQDRRGLIAAAQAHQVPVGAFMSEHVQQGALLNYAADLFATGVQAADLAHAIRQGLPPAELPVETSEYFLTVNLKAAQAIDLPISDDILRRADTILR